MKNYNRYGLIPALAAAALALGSCNESIRTYDGQTGIYFAMLQSGSDEENPRYTADSSLPFALLPSGTDEQTLQLRVKVIGSVADYPRAFAFRTVADRTTAQEGHDYELPEGDCVVAAGEVYGYIPIRFFRRASLDGEERAGRTVYEDYLDGEGNPVKMESGPDSAE